MRAGRFVSLLGFLIISAGLSAGRGAEAAWLEDGSPTPTAASGWRVPPPPPPPPPPTHPIERWIPPYEPPVDAHGRVVREFLGGAYLGTPYGWGGLTIVPVLVPARTASPSLRSLESALRSGSFYVREYGSGSVPTVEVDNRGSTAVFLLAGEMILGGKQDRVIREDMVIGPYSGPVQVPVYCVEQGRWASSAERFDSAPHAMAGRDLRSKAAAGAGQAEIWSHVERESEERGVRSPTSSYGDVVASPEVSRRLDEYVAHCPRPSVWRGRAVGAVFLSGGSVLGVDLFADPGLLAALWPKLVRSYASQAYSGSVDRRYYPSDSGASAALEALRAAWPSFSGWAGSAPRLSLSVSGYDAWAIPWEGGVAHVAALPSVRAYVPPPPPPPWYDEVPRPRPHRELPDE